jgi:hypothetical protein
MRINFAHIRERSTTGGYIDFAVFDANANSGRNEDRADLLQALTLEARRLGLKVDISALIYSEHGQIKTYGAQTLVDYLAKSGIPQWTHYIDI